MLTDSVSGPAPSSFSTRPVTLADAARWLRHALARNPFYILSAALLLLSMRLLSGDSRIFPHETPQLLFNFSSFQVYELLLVGTAILLARRKIWYDAGLLVGMENLFMFVPFILVSQALLLENRIALAFCLGGCALAALRMHALKRWLTDLNMPPVLLGTGAGLLVANLAIPVATRLLHAHVSVPAWDERGAILKNWEWNWLLPLAAGALYFLPPSEQSNAAGERPLYSRPCFPLFASILWIAGTAAHLYCVGFVYGLPWAVALLAPTLWVTAWILWRHRAALDFIPAKFSRHAHAVLFVLPLAAALFAAWAGNWKCCCWLALLNVAVYGAIAEASLDRRALHLGLISAIVALASLPHYGIHYPHTHLLGAGIVGYLILLSLWSRLPQWGILGGMGLAGVVGAALSNTAANTHLAIQLGLVFIVLHSVFWGENSRRLRLSLAIIWLIQGAMWLAADPNAAGFGTFLVGFAVAIVYFCARAVSGQWGPRVVPYAALALMAMNPAVQIAGKIPETPDGLLVLIGSFALFALGTAAAMTKGRWYRGNLSL